MDSGISTKTTRKGFLQRAGVAIAGAFAMTSLARSKSQTPAQTATVSEPAAMSRIQTAKGAVPRSHTNRA